MLEDPAPSSIQDDDKSSESVSTTSSFSTTSGEEKDQNVYSHVFRLTGCSIEERYQSALEKLRHAMLTAKQNKQKHTVEITAKEEWDNPVDCNAISFQGREDSNSTWEVLGYVQLNKIPKMKKALLLNEIISYEMAIPRYRRSSKYSGFFSSVNVCKKKLWLPSDNTNTYNKL